MQSYEPQAGIGACSELLEAIGIGQLWLHTVARGRGSLPGGSGVLLVPPPNKHIIIPQHKKVILQGNSHDKDHCWGNILQHDVLLHYTIRSD